ncbi:MAG: sigma-70 family RNA polymerase sigma factor [Clostridia bacterium]|nr:sigma-70 family RNA polymerase sigma factor [Clostridia bacterium]
MTDTVFDEKELVESALKGDSEAFGGLVALYEKRIYSFALGMLSDPDDAFDVSQDTFLKAYRSLNSFKGESSFYTWLYAICRNCCYDYIKQRSRRMKKNISLSEYENDDDGAMVEIPDTASQPDLVLEKKQAREKIIEAVASLPEKHREIIVLRDFEDLSYEQIAEALDISEGTVKSRLSRARMKLQAILADKI